MNEATTTMTNAEFLTALHEAEKLERQHGREHPDTVAAFNHACVVIPDWMLDDLPPEDQRGIRFVKACNNLERIVEQHGKYSAEAGAAVMQCMKYAPQAMQDAMHATMKELIQLPAPTKCDGDGNPLYSLQDVAQALGVSEEEAQEAMTEMLAAHEAAGLDVNDKIITDPAKVHTMQ